MTTEGNSRSVRGVPGLVTFSHGDHFQLLFCDDGERMPIALIRVFCIHSVTSIWYIGGDLAAEFYHPIMWSLKYKGQHHLTLVRIWATTAPTPCEVVGVFMKEIIILCFCSGHLDKLFTMVFCVSLCLLEKIYHVFNAFDCFEDLLFYM